MSMFSKHSRRQNGFSIVELMVALAVGAVLLIGVIEVFIGSKQTYRTIDELSRMQENGRFVMELVTRTLRSAGYNGCSTREDALTNTLNKGDSDGDGDVDDDDVHLTFDFSTGVGGFEANGSAPGTTVAIASENPAPGGTWAGGTVPADVTALAIPGSDILLVRGPAGNSIPIARNNNGAQVFAEDTTTIDDGCPGNNVDKYGGICPGDILMITDCRKSRVFQATGLQATSANPCSNDDPCINITHTASGDPGNDLTSWGGSADPLDQQFDEDSEILRVQSYTFFVGRGIDGTPSFYQKINAGAPAEMVAGVENMQVLYGEDTDADGIANQYRTANNVADYTNVVSMRIALLVRTDGNISPDTNTQTYILNGTTTAIGTTVNPFNDRRGRYVFGTTIKLRNRGV